MRKVCPVRLNATLARNVCTIMHPEKNDKDAKTQLSLTTVFREHSDSGYDSDGDSDIEDSDRDSD